MRLSILCTDPGHPVITHIKVWQSSFSNRGHEVEVIHDKNELSGGDVLFLVSCGQLISEAERENYGVTLVLHASDLPQGRGWSPHVWSIVSGSNDITVCLLEADEPVDSGSVWLRKRFSLEGHELLSEINEKLFRTELELMSEAIERFDDVKPQRQIGEQGCYLQKRTPEDSRLDPEKTIAEQFDLLRVVDYQRYPAFMDFRGSRYVIDIKKVDSDGAE